MEIKKYKDFVKNKLNKPLDPKSMFLSLVSKTTPYGTEKGLLKYLPDMNSDDYGNYYITIGGGKSPEVMFTSHLDTKGEDQVKVKTFSKKNNNGDEIIYTDGQSILGADGKAGVTVMIYMMEKEVPGLYYFFIGEEEGSVGSKELAKNFNENEQLKNVKKCVSFDRKGTQSIISHQSGEETTSKEFIDSLIKQYKDLGLEMIDDPTGVYTDSASFVKYIPECTNISVGYENAHSEKEEQNMTYLIRLCEASSKINWDSLPTKRKLF